MTRETTEDVGLKPRAFTPLPLGQVRPEGWLLEQLRIQADGLSGHLDEFWPDIADSAWFGGESDGWERGPYWLGGMVPLAFLVDDERLKAKVHRWVEYILAHQQEDGWFGVLKRRARRGRDQPGNLSVVYPGTCILDTLFTRWGVCHGTRPWRSHSEWVLEHNAAGPVPPSPVTTGEAITELTLIPFGATNLRIAEFPVLAREPETGHQR